MRADHASGISEEKVAHVDLESTKVRGVVVLRNGEMDDPGNGWQLMTTRLLMQSEARS